MIDFTVGLISGTLFSVGSVIYIYIYEKKQTNLRIKELNHRIQNNLSILLSLIQHHQRSPLQKDFPLLVNLENKLYSFALLYKHLNLDTHPKTHHKRYLEELIQHFKRSYGNRKKELNINFNYDETPLCNKTLNIIGIILNELITNSYKHTKSNELTISIQKSENEIHLIYDDNSVSYNNISFKSNQEGLGLIKSLVQSINGEIIVLNAGAFCKITF